MATIAYLPAGIIPNDTGATAPSTNISYNPAGIPPNDIAVVAGGSPMSTIYRWLRNRRIQFPNKV